MSTEVVRAWDEPAGAVARGTVVVVPGRGEGPAQYRRFGARIAGENWRVRLVDLDLDDTSSALAELRAVVADDTLPSPKVLVGVDAGAVWATRVADPVGTDAVVVAGAASTSPRPVGGWPSELDARTACPVHRGVLESDPTFERGSLSRPLPTAWATPVPPLQPTLVLHGDADPVTPLAEAVNPYADAPQAVVKVVHGGRHDVLNDATHRAVAATLVLFLESLRLGRDLPPIVSELVPAGAGA